MPGYMNRSRLTTVLPLVWLVVVVGNLLGCNFIIGLPVFWSLAETAVVIAVGAMLGLLFRHIKRRRAEVIDYNRELDELARRGD